MTSKKDGCPLAHNHQSSSLKNKVSSAFEVPNKRDRGNDHANGDVNEGGHNNKASFKKGPWTAEEDALLMGYVQKHGERHWNCVQKTGLMRCGKSCRLRWTNHLRPDLKKGAFSPEEERIVLDLHAKLGNKWSTIAAELPGRTDNEVKNFWNTKIKRRMKANQLMVNSQGHRLQEGIAFHQHLHQQKTLKAQGQQDLSSIPNAINSMHSSLASFHTTTNSIPTSASILRAQYLGKLGDNFIRSTQLKDPILSFLNNPAYKCQFPSEEEKSNCDTGKSFYLSVSSHVPRFELPQNSSMADTFLPIHSHARSSSLDTASTNTVFTRNPMGLVEPTINATQCGSPLSKAYADLDLNNLLPTNRKVVSKGMAESMYAKIDQPCSLVNYEQIPAYGMVGVDGGINDSWISSLLERNSDIEKSSITEEEKCVLDGNIASEELREMAAVTVGKKRLRDDRSITTCIVGVKKLKVEPSEDLVAMDDDLCSLLHDFSSIGSPTPLYSVDNEVSMPNSKEAFEFPQAATIPSESLAATIATPTTSTSEFNCNKDNNCCTNPNENTLNC